MARFMTHWITTALALGVTAWIVPGVRVHSLLTLLIAAIVLGLINAVVRPLLVILTLTGDRHHPRAVLPGGQRRLVRPCRRAGSWLQRQLAAVGSGGSPGHVTGVLVRRLVRRRPAVTTMARIKVRRTHREELPGLGLLREAASGEASLSGRRLTLDLELDVDPDLDHLIRHDPDSFLTALDGDETVGFLCAHIRSRQWILSEIAVLPQHRGRGAGELLLSRAMEYASRAGVREFLALANESTTLLALLLRRDFAPVVPVYELRLCAEAAATTGAALSRLLPGQDVTDEILNQRGQSDVDRIDRLARGVTRDLDHIHWIKEKGCNVAFVRQGNRVAGYGFGSSGIVGPVAGSTQDAALSALGWALSCASADNQDVELALPASFQPAIEALLDGGAMVGSTRLLMGRGVNGSFDRYLPRPGTLL